MISQSKSCSIFFKDAKGYIFTFFIAFFKNSIVLLSILIFFLRCDTSGGKHINSNYTGQLIWTGIGPDFHTGDISPDGKYFTDIDWNTGNLNLVNLETGKSSPLTNDGYESGGYAWMSSFSSDGKQLAFEWYNYETGTHELRLYSFNTNTSKILIPSTKEILYVEPLDWSYDDQFILLAIKAINKDWVLGTVSIENGKIIHLINLGNQAPGGANPYAYANADWSPDDRYIGFDYVSDKINNSWDLFSLSIETGEKKILLEGKGSDRFMSWNEDGSEILFYSDRTGNPSLWQLAVKNGVADGEPKLLVENIQGINPIGYCVKGFAFGLTEGDWNTYIASIDFKNGTILENPKPVDSSYAHRNNVGDWSKDGSQLLYISFNDMPDSKEFAIIKSIDSNKERKIPFPDNFHNKTGSVAWISESNILIDGNSPTKNGIHLFNLETKQINIPADFGEKGFFQRFKSNSDGSLIYVEIKDDRPRIVEMETETGKQRTILNGSIIPSSIGVSPNDEEIAYLKIQGSNGIVSLEVLNLSNGKFRVIRQEKSGVFNQPLAWTPNGERILVGVNLSKEKQGLWSIHVHNNSNPIFIDLPELVGNTLSMNPDGQHIAFQKGISKGSLYFLDNF